MKTRLLLTALLALNGALFAQSPPCAADVIQQWKEQADSTFRLQHKLHSHNVNQYRTHLLQNNQFWQHYYDTSDPGDHISGGPLCRKARYIIPVVVHIVHNPAHSTPGTGSNISDAQVENQIEALNDDFANINGGAQSVNTNIQFCLATNVPGGTGIMRHADIATHHFIHQYDSLFTRYNLDESKYLNIYVVSNLRDSSGSVVPVSGYGLFPFEPGKHGIVIRYDKFGNAQTCTSCNLDTSSRGKILVHEAGHFLGLYHPFYQSCEGIHSHDCHSKGDLCCDVPPANQAYYDCNSRNTCTETYNGNPDDMTENYMGYASESCINTFTPDQVSIMHSTLEGLRNSLVSPVNTTSANLSCCVFSAHFVADNVFICDEDSVRLQAIKYTGAEYRWRVIKNGNTSFYTDTTAKLGLYLSDTGQYHISLTVWLDGDSVRAERYAYIEVKDCGEPLPSTQGCWYFGEFSGLFFKENGVIPDFSALDADPRTINTYQGCISHSNEHGSLLFYGGGGPFEGVDTDSFYLYNKNHQKMLNGPVWGDGSSEAGGLVVPYPADGTKFYLFTTSTNTNNNKNGIHYSIIDTTMDNGAGGVILQSKNTALKAPVGSDFNFLDSALVSIEGITAIPKCNGIGHWLITVDNGYSNLNSEKFIIYSIDTDGVKMHRVSDAKAYVTPVPAQLKASPDGTKIAFQGDVFDFDRSSGDLVKRYASKAFAHGTAFSSNSEVVYFLESEENDKSLIYQLDLNNPNEEDARKLVAELENVYPFQHFQLGPDGKIYMSNYGINQLGVINYPDNINHNLLLNNCGFSLNGPLLSSGNIGGKSKWGLPNMMDARALADVPVKINVTIKSCDSVYFSSTENCSSFYNWNFGDGNSSSLEKPVHFYSKDSVYQVIFLSDRGSDTLLVKIGLVEPVISGEEYVCDTSGLVSYTILNQLANVQYTWSVTTGTLYQLPGSLNTANVKWDGDGIINVTSYDSKTGCSSNSVRSILVASVNGNHIADNQIVCPNENPTQINGLLPITNAAFNYLWQSKLADDNWQNISNSNSQNYQPAAINQELVQYRRIVQIQNCHFNSNEIAIVPSISNNIVTLQHKACFPGDEFFIQGNEPSNAFEDSIITYQWEVLKNNGWVITSSLDSLISLYDTADIEPQYYRRKASSAGCEVYSDSIKVYPQIKIVSQPKDYTTCNNRIYFTISYENPDNLDLNFQWMFKNNLQEFPTLIGSINKDTLNYLTTSGYGSYYVCLISTNTPSCSYESEWALYKRNPDTLTWFEPISLSDTLIQERDSALIIAKHTGVEVSPEIFAKQYFWQRSDDGINFYNVTATGNGRDSFMVNGLRACEGAFYYRMGIRAAEDCPVEYSSVTPAIRSYTEAKLLMQDYTDDNGTEPNLTTDWRNLYEPPSLFIRYNNDGQTAHQIPNLAEHSGVYVYYNIKNIGTDTSKAADLYLYWTSGGPHGADWPIAWHDMTGNRFTVINPNSLQLGSQLSWGDKINQTPITIPPIAPGDSLFDAYFWNTLPNPQDFHSIFNGDTTYPNERALCLLARVETCSNDSFGMSFKETRATRQNIINNRKIVGRNSWLQFIDQEQRIVEYPLTVRSYDGIDLPLRLLMTNVDSCAFQTIGFVTAELSDGLWQEWEAGGFEGTGFSFDAEHTLLIDNLSDFQLNNIHLSPENTEQIKISFESTIWPEEPMFCRYALGQFHGETIEPEGSFVIAVEVSTFEHNNTASFYIPTHEVEQDSLTNINASIIAEENSETLNRLALAALDQLTIFPNPANKQINFAFEIQQDLPTEILLTNALGATVATVYRGKLQSGYTLIPWQNQHLTSGLYIAQVKIGAQTRNYKIIITNQ